MRRHFLYIVALLELLICSPANAYDFEVDGIAYNIISTAERTVEITVADTKYSGDFIIPETVKYGNTVFNVIKIGDGAFRGTLDYTSGAHYISELTSVTIPNCITSVGASAFFGCVKLESVIIPNSVTSIGSYAFKNCRELGSVTLPNNITFIDNGTFNGCYQLETIDIPSSVTSIGESVFGRCKELKSINIGNNVKTIGNSAFEDCSNLTAIVLPNNMETIETYVFKGLQ